ncbi:unnamed protein product [Owenia fusiformis]|uniref:C2 domain-containing protein n=1 Tax=Owenia fusiformis TaxID=6347 RepID=A0A8S4NGB6_OWEFU|nr:unnamed protein product [Owenia fusiformis]
MDDTDKYPVREPKMPRISGAQNVDDRDHAQQRAAQEARMIARWTREDLEDKYLRLYEENIIIKKHARKQEDKIKRMATKLLRLVSDKKKREGDQGGRKGRDIETEEMVEELQSKVRDLEKQNSMFKEKLMVTKAQLQTQGKRHTPYGHVPSRINTGIPKPPPDPRVAKNIRVMGPPRDTQRTVNSPGLPRYGHSLLEEAREENRHLEHVIDQLNDQLGVYEQDIEMLKEEVRMKESDFEEDLLKIKQQMTAGQRTNIQENIDIIRLQREIKEKSTKLTALQDKYTQLEHKLRNVTESHDQILEEMESLSQQLKDSQNKNLTLQNELKGGSASQRTILELEEQLVDLKKERDILTEANEKLVSSAFDLEREREWRQRENALKVQVAQLEATLKADVGEKGGILDRLTTEREDHEQLQNDFREVQVKYFQLKEEHDELSQKMQFFTRESAVDFQEIEEALVIVKQRKEKGTQDLDFLEKVDGVKQKDATKEILEIQAEYAETINELEKTRNMLIVQHRINKDYQTEVAAVTSKMEENRKEYETKLEEYAQLLDIRAARIKKLEAQMKDVAYGTKQYKIREMEESEVEEIDETLHLERGHNMFEIHISKVLLSKEALKFLGDDEPTTFCTWEFYEFEIQSTPVVKGARVDINFTSQYEVKVDDIFLHYLQKDGATLELHQSYGTDYRTVGACQLKFTDIFDKPSGRIHGNVTVLGVSHGEGNGLNLGTVEYWVRLRVPMDQALRLYKERTKALGYLATNLRTTEQALEALDETAAQRPSDNVNQLQIKVIRCAGIKARRKDVQPSPYCVYKFFDFPDHDTTIIQSSNEPQFNDHKSFPVAMTADLDRYLKSHPLQIYVFDDTDPEEVEYLGRTDVPLLALAHDKAIQGTFELKQKSGAINGTIEVYLQWQYTYIPPKVGTKTPAQILATTPAEKPGQPIFLPGEDEIAQSPAVSGSVTFAMTPGEIPPSGPKAMSTPIPIDKEIRPSTAQNRPQPTPSKSSYKPDVVQMKPQVVQGQKKQRSPPQEDQGSAASASDSNQDEPESTGIAGTPLKEPHPPTPQKPPRPLPKARTLKREDGSKIAAAAVGVAAVAGGVAMANAETPTITITDSSVGEMIEDDDDGGKEDSKKDKKDKKKSKEAAQPPEEEDEEDSDDDIVVATGAMATGQSDTMFGDQGDDDDEDSSLGDEVDLPQDSLADTYGETLERESDSEGVVVSPAPPRPVSQAGNPNVVIITISSVSLDEDSPVMSDPSVQMLFVEYRFLQYPPEELETVSLPKPKPNREASYNFRKVFHVDYEENFEVRQYLASMLLPDDPNEGKVRFTVVSEPPENEEEDSNADCQDIGVAYVSFLDDILKPGHDIVDQDVPLYDAEGDDVIGSLRLTVECYAALAAIQQEMDEAQQ